MFLFFILFFLNFLSTIPIFNILIFYLGLLSVIVGTFIILYETRVKKFIALSSTIAFGFIFICFSLKTYITIALAIMFYFVYIFNLIFFFTIYLVIKTFNKNDYITNLFSYSKNNKYLSILFSISLLSLIGIPPLMGFFLKFLLFYFLILNNNYFICLLVILLSIISCIYYARFIRFLFFDIIKIDFKTGLNLKLSTVIILILILFFFISLFFFFYCFHIFLYIKQFFMLSLCIY